MTDISKLKKGVSIGFVGKLCCETFETCAQNNIDCVEVCYSYASYIEQDFIGKAAKYAEMAAAAGVELWSIHLPFSQELDISSPDNDNREFTVNINMNLIRAAAAAGIKTVVLHPSSEPISDEERPSRIARSRENILLLGELCRSLSLVLAVENLPRTCLCNKSAETLELLSGTKATLCFDFNHSLIENNGEFLRNIIVGGLQISTVHISDYDFIDERHRLPGDGVVNWREVLDLLETADYSGPLMYEVSRHPKERELINIEELSENQRRLALKQIR